MNDICLAPNSPGAMEAARAYRDGDCILLADGRPSWWCRHSTRSRPRLGGDIHDIYVWDGSVEQV